MSEFIYKSNIYHYIRDDIKGKLVFDAGANIGAVSGKLVRLGCKVICVEPQKELCGNKGYDGVFAIENVCIGNKIGETHFYKCLDHHSTSSCRSDWKIHQPNKRWIKVKMPMVTIDYLVEKYGLPFYIKVDIEGKEDELCEGMSKNPSMMSIEFVRQFPEVTTRSLEILDSKFGIKELMPFVKKRMIVKENRKKFTKEYAYCGKYSSVKEFLKDFDKFLGYTAIGNRNVGDLLIRF